MTGETDDEQRLVSRCVEVDPPEDVVAAACAMRAREVLNPCGMLGKYCLRYCSRLKSIETESGDEQCSGTRRRCAGR